MIDPAVSAPIARAHAVATPRARVAVGHAPAVFASSFGAEDMVLLDLVARAGLPIRAFTLDTGRLPQETHDLIDRARAHYGVAIDVHAPQAEAIRAYGREHGGNAFYRGIEQRQQCCAIGKGEPPRRALGGARAWITGLRRAQGTTRRDVAIEQLDTTHGLPKFNPLADWSADDVWSYLRAHHVPWNAQRTRRPARMADDASPLAVEPARQRGRANAALTGARLRSTRGPRP